MIGDVVGGLGQLLLPGPLLGLLVLAALCLAVLAGIGVGRRLQRHEDEDARIAVRIAQRQARHDAEELAGARAVGRMPQQRGGS